MLTDSVCSMMLFLFVYIYFFTMAKADQCMDNQQCDTCEGNGLCMSTCYRGYFGLQCQYKCEELGCRYNICSLENGIVSCTFGCKLGFVGIECKTPCISYVHTCTKCPQECVGGFCDRGSSCAPRCKNSYYGTACFSCKGWCKVCNRVSGTCDVCHHCEGNCTHGCLNGCKAGYYGYFCEHTCHPRCMSGCDQYSGGCLRCGSGWYGATCMNRCSKECMDKVCDSNGICTNACKEGWYGPRCEFKCSTGCQGEICARNGTCTYGCVVDFFGKMCEHKCPTSCLNRDCDREDGFCKICEKGFHGRQCEKTCTRCVDGFCMQGTGHCIRGCLPNYKGEFCQHDCERNCTFDECPEVCKSDGRSNYTFYMMVTTVVFVFVMAVLVPYAGCRFKRLHNQICGQRRQFQRESTEYATEPTVNFYCDIDGDTKTSSQDPRRCGTQLSIQEGSLSPNSSSQSRGENSDDVRTSNSPESILPAHAEHNGFVENEGVNADSIELSIYLTTAGSQGLCLSVTSIHAQASASDADPLQNKTGYLKDCSAASNVNHNDRKLDENPILCDNTPGQQRGGSNGNKGCATAADSNNTYQITREPSQDGGTDEEVSTISVPIIADCYDNFSVDDEQEAIPNPPPDNYSKLFTTNYDMKNVNS